MRAVWMVRSRQIVRKFAWWLTILGYDHQDRSLTNRIYQVYVTIFWGWWFFVVLGLLAGPAKNFLIVLGFMPLNQAVTLLISLALLSWGLYKLWGAARRSPIVFSENDAHLICQTPVPGNSVALAWLLGDWFEPALPFWAAAVTMSFALVESSLEHEITIIDLTAYLTAGLKALLIIALLQLGMMALVWAAGALRLQRDRQLTWQPRAVRLGILAVGMALIYALIYWGPGGLNHLPWQVVLWPLVFPLSAAFGSVPLLFGLLMGLVWCGLGLVILTRASAHLNLSRAAQETTQLEKIETAQRYGQTELAQQLALTNRLSGGHLPSNLPVRSGDWMLGWKDVLQSGRALSLSDTWGWLALSAVSLGVCLVSEPGARGLLLAFWGVMVGQHVTTRLQKDLANWSLLRLLPFSSARLLLAELAFPWALVVLLGWIVLALAGGGWAFHIRLSAALLLPCLSAAVSFAAAYDLQRQARSDMLLTGSAPQVSSLGGLLGILCLAMPLGFWFVLRQVGLVGGIVAASLAALLALLFWSLASRQLQHME